MQSCDAIVIGTRRGAGVPGRRVKLPGDDPDNRILECAAAGRADLIVTGDEALLALGID